ncbi:hypothetical protein Trydic_g13804 [Trypoxylus dichotomus]
MLRFENENNPKRCCIVGNNDKEGDGRRASKEQKEKNERTKNIRTYHHQTGSLQRGSRRIDSWRTESFLETGRLSSRKYLVIPWNADE